MSKEHFTNQSAQNRGSETWADGICTQKTEVTYRNGNCYSFALAPLERGLNAGNFRRCDYGGVEWRTVLH